MKKTLLTVVVVFAVAGIAAAVSLPFLSPEEKAVGMNTYSFLLSQTVQQGKTFTISLESNPSTGFSWLPSMDNANLVLTSNTCNPLSPNPATGAPCKQVLTFRGAKAGKTALTLKYARPFEPTVPPAKTLSYVVTVTK